MIKIIYQAMKLKQLIYILIALVLFVIILLTIDILTGFWYWNRYNLIFDSYEFNNLVTPSLTIIATIIYAYALFLSLKQNKIVLSQNIKPHYERETENLINDARNIKIENKTIHSDQDINVTNYIQFINESILNLAKNKEFLEDYQNYNKGEKITSEYIMNRDYICDLMFLSGFTMLNKVSFFYDKLKGFIEEINHSKLISEDKELIKKRLTGSLLSDYISFIEFEDNYGNIIPPVPLLFADLNKSEVKFEHISKTDFRKHYEYFKKEFNKP
ncbi:hypothetical protein CLU81_4957 [Flavobacterium sp. 9]|uniref:hypothetical protein n=1 Tax=Flavobacterium sp. 9 TaxID=2035198 RepID=UPI000C19E838|nr:hypothetical protein [Flavobacterium sp. 9]PIF34318.1 hypothetical protein CLU81_4957 [Flavobacterium sp. 9]